MRLKQIKKFLILGAATTVTFVSMGDVNAQAVLNQIATNTGNTNSSVTSGNGYLQQIANYTQQMMNTLNTQLANFQVDYVGVIFPLLSNFLNSWTAADTSDPTANMQTLMASLGSTVTGDTTIQNTTWMTKQINASLFNPNNNNKINLNTLQKVMYWGNDLTYGALLTQTDPVTHNPAPATLFNPDPRQGKHDPAYNYILHASGIGMSHIIPGSNPQDPTSPIVWKGIGNTPPGLPNPAIQRYIDYYNTIIAAESFGGYVLGNQYSENKNNNQFTSLQSKLISSATDSTNWFSQISSENLGVVLRQILLFESQVFVMMAQMLQVQKQMLTAQVMTNSLLIATNLDKENLMSSYAQGKAPSQ